MPLLMCPNDNTAMQTLDRAGVQFDMCPSCRGVWLDRGELEKLMEGAANEARGAPIVASAPQPQPQPQTQQSHVPPQQGAWGAPQPSYGYQSHQGYQRDDRHRDERRRDDDYAYRKKKKRMDIFDIFD